MLSFTLRDIVFSTTMENECEKKQVFKALNETDSRRNKRNTKKKGKINFLQTNEKSISNKGK